MLKVYGHPDCPDCRNCCKNFDNYNIEYEYYDIRELKNLKQFLIYRDTNPRVFDRLKMVQDIGVPAIVDGSVVFTDWEAYLKYYNHEPIDYEKKSCSLLHKNC